LRALVLASVDSAPAYESTYHAELALTWNVEEDQ